MRRDNKAPVDTTKHTGGDQLPGQIVTGIDLFANVVLHEKVHVWQMQQAELVVPGWTWNVPSRDPRYNHGAHDADQDDLPDSIDPDDNYRAIGVEWQAQQRREVSAEDNYANVDWGSPGKQHGPQKDGAGNRYDD